MSRSQEVFRSFGASALAKALRAVARIGLLLIAARAFTLAEVGEFAFVMGVGTLIMGLLDLGVTSLLQREVSSRNDNAAALEREALSIRLLTLPIGLAIGWVFASTVAPSLHVSAIGTLVFTGGLATVDFTTGVKRARGLYRLESLEVGPMVGACLVAGIGTVLLGGGFHAFQWSVGLAAGVFAAQRVWSLVRQVGLFAVDGREAIFRLMWQARWFWVMTVGALVLIEAPLILLQELASEEEVALYATAMRAVGLGSQPFVVLAAVFVPSLAYEAHQAQSIYRESIKSLNDLFLLALPAAFSLIVAGGFVLLAAAGPEYFRAVPVLLILAIGTLIYLGAPNAGPLLVDGWERPLGVTVFIAAVTTIAACAALIPSYGATGAALGALGGFFAGKIGHALLYQAAGLPFTSPLGLVATSVVAIWAILLVLLPDTSRLYLLSVGGLISLVLTFRLMRRKRVFGSRDGLLHREPGDRPPGRVKTRLKKGILRHTPALFWLWQRIRHGPESFEPETALLRYLCKDDQLSLDVGANYGVYVHDMLPYSGRVHAFEPIPELAELLRRTFRHELERVVVHEVALSDSDGTAVLRIPERFPGRSTIEPSNDLEDSLPHRTNVATVEVQQRRLDSLDFDATGFIKIDVEGHELEVLHGAHDLLARDHPALLVEIEERHRAGGLEQVREFLRDLGYLAYWWESGCLRELSKNRPPPGDVRNFVFLTSAEFQTVRDELCRGLSSND